MIIFLSIFILALFFYFYKNVGAFIFSIFALITNCFGFVSSENLGIKADDLVLVLVLLVTINESRRDRDYFKLKNDNIAIILVIILLFLFLEAIGTVIFNIETPSYAFKVIRHFFVLPLYFYIRKQNQKDIEKFIKLGLIASVVQGIFYYLQPLGVLEVISGRIVAAKDIDEITRYANYPMLATFFTIYYVVKDKGLLVNKLFFIAFFFFMLILGQSRGAVLRLAITLMIYFAIIKKTKNIFYIIIGAILFIFIVNPMFDYRTRNKSKSTFEEIVDVIKDPQNTYYSYEQSEDNFSFRVAMLMERIIYLERNPQHLPLGVGCIHEESPNNHFMFQIGTHNERYKYGYGMISSADIAWVAIILRYGLIGTFFFLLLFYYWTKSGLRMIRNIHSPIYRTSALLSVTYFLASFNGDILGRAPALILIITWLAIIYLYQNKKHG